NSVITVCSPFSFDHVICIFPLDFISKPPVSPDSVLYVIYMEIMCHDPHQPCFVFHEIMMGEWSLTFSDYSAA
ncbi:MAG: hypothetical protein IJV50_10370, partial [Lachnospiraceae bacterium]|nr:hypothetical protein [Lachnospiraceae bacterium]